MKQVINFLQEVKDGKYCQPKQSVDVAKESRERLLKELSIMIREDNERVYKS